MSTMNKIPRFLAMAMMLALLMGGQTASAATSTATIGFSNAATPLTLNQVPAFSFGTDNAIPATDTTFPALTVTDDLEVTDSRGLNLISGWTVTAQLGAFSPDEGETTTLDGAVLTLNGGKVSQNGGLKLTVPIATPVIALISDGAAVNVFTTVGVATLTGGEYHAAWTASNVSLTVLGGTATSGTHVATINWTLSAL